MSKPKRSMFEEIQEGLKELRDERKRREHDEWLALVNEEAKKQEYKKDE